MSLVGKLNATVYASPTVLLPQTLPERLAPHKAVNVRPEEAPLLNGFPRKPKYWVRVQPEISATGVVYAANRPEPLQVALGSDYRWLPGETTWDPSTGVWDPSEGSGDRYFFSPAGKHPVLYEDRRLSGNELIVRPAFRINSGNYFFTQYRAGLSYYNTLTLSMVVSLQPAEGDYPILDWHGSTPTSTERLGLWHTDKIDYFWGGTGNSVDPIVAAAKYQPAALTLVIDPPSVSCYFSYSFRHHFYTSKAATDVANSVLNFALGYSYLGSNDADFSLYEFNYWAAPLSSDEVVNLHNQYFAIYGTHSDWA